MRWNQLTPPNAQDALTAVVAIIAMYGLLILPSLGMIKLQVDREISLVALPVIIVVSLGVPAWLLLRYLRNHQVETGFLPLGRRGWHLSWQVPLLIVGSGIASAMVGPLLGISPGEEFSAAQQASSSGQILPVVLVLLAYLLLGPFVEELVFRRVLMGYFDTLMPAALSVLSSALLFSLVHVSPPVILFNTFMGIGYAVLTRWHGTLWAGLIAHILNNALVELLILNGA